MKRLLSLLAVLTTILCAVGASPANAGVPSDVGFRWNDPGFQKQAIALLDVLRDGTVRVNDWSRAKRLFGREFRSAMIDLETWNEKVRAGLEPGFRSREELASHAIILDEDWLARAQDDASPDAVLAATAPYCRGGWIGKCVNDTCCCGGWWFFCTQLCSPCRTK